MRGLRGFSCTEIVHVQRFWNHCEGDPHVYIHQRSILWGKLSPLTSLKVTHVMDGLAFDMGDGRRGGRRRASASLQLLPGSASVRFFAEVHPKPPPNSVGWFQGVATLRVGPMAELPFSGCRLVHGWLSMGPFSGESRGAIPSVAIGAGP